MSQPEISNPGYLDVEGLVEDPGTDYDGEENQSGEGDVQEQDSPVNVVTHVAPPANTDPDRAQWSNKWQFLLSCIGYAVGLGNVWRFPYLCYSNGGGTFLIPYAIMLFVEGIPLFFLELSLGQFMKKGAFGTFKKIHPALGGIGLASGVCSFLVSMYYNMIIAWTIYYLCASFRSKLPWDGYECVPRADRTNCTDSAEQNYWFQEVQHASPSMLDAGSPEWDLVLCLLASWVILGLCMIKGIMSAEYAVYFTATFPYVVLVILFFRGITLEGAGEGIEFYLKPDLAKLADSQVWRDAAGQILYSLSPGFGTLIAYASYNESHNDTLKDALIVSLINCGTSVFAGFAIFSILGHMAHKKGVSVSEVVDGGPGLAFVAYPEAVLEISGSVFWSILFFSMLLTLGLDSQFGSVEAMLTVLEDFGIGNGWRMSTRTLVVCGVSFVCGLIFTINGGIYYFQLFDEFAAALPLLFITFMELVAVSWIYGVDNFIADVETMTNRTLSRWWWYAWKWVTPFCTIQIEDAEMGITLICITMWCVGFIFLWSVIDLCVSPPQYTTSTDSLAYPPAAQFLAAALVLASTLCIPVYALIWRSSIKSTWRDFLHGISQISLQSIRRELTPPTRVARKLNDELLRDDSLHDGAQQDDSTA